MGTRAISGGWAATASLGPMRMRVVLAALSTAAVAASNPWTRSSASAGVKLAELLLCVLAWEASMVLCRRAASARLGRTDPSPAMLAGLVLAASLPATAGMLVAFALVGDTASSPVPVYGQSLALGFLIAFARRGLRSARVAPTEVATPAPRAGMAPAPVDPAAAFLRRHAPRLAHRRLLALQAEDHYLRIHTDGGTALVLLRMTDAVAVLGPEAGWRPHRSFWLAAGVPARAERSGQAWKLTLPDGLVVPVSRANADAMRAAGYGRPSSAALPPPGTRAT